MYHKYNWEKANKILLENFKIPSTNQEIDRKIEKLEHQITKINEEIPSKNIKRTNHGLDKATLAMIKRKRKLYRDYKKKQILSNKTGDKQTQQKY